MQVNIIDAYRTIVAIADTDLVGKQFEEGKKFLDIKETFYKGEEKNAEELKEIIHSFAREDATFNIVGKDSIEIAKNINLITEDSIGTIDGIPYAMFLL